MTTLKDKILSLLRTGAKTTRELQEATGATAASIYQAIGELQVEPSLIIASERDPQGPGRCWYLTEIRSRPRKRYLALDTDDYQRLVALADGMGLTPEQYIVRIVLGREGGQ